MGLRVSPVRTLVTNLLSGFSPPTLTMDDIKTSADKLSTDEEVTVGYAKQIDLANNVQARYASSSFLTAYRPPRYLVLSSSLKNPKSSSKYPSEYAATASRDLRCWEGSARQDGIVQKGCFAGSESKRFWASRRLDRRRLGNHSSWNYSWVTFFLPFSELNRRWEPPPPHSL